MTRLLRFSLIAAFAIAFGALAVPARAQEGTQTQDQPALEPVDVFQGAGILILKTPDDSFRWWLDGRIQLDSASYMNSDNTLANGVEARRIRFATNMVLWKTWASQFDVDYADNAVDVKDLWIGYTGLKHSFVQIGNFKEPFGLETLTSSRYISFMERSLIDNMSPDRHVGAAFSNFHNRWTATGGLFGPALADTVDQIGSDQAYSMTARATVLPYLSGRSFVHLGIAGSYETPKAAVDPTLKDLNQMRLRARPETNVSRGRFIDTKKMSNIDHRNLVGLEAAAVFGPVSFQSEYNRATYKRTVATLPVASFDGWYAYGSWFVTGEVRPYDKATGDFARVMPRSKRGALELLTRFSTMDLNDAAATIFGGKEKITTIGANWYTNANIKVMTNYLFVVNDQYAVGDRGYLPNDKFNVLQARLALMF